MSAVLPRKRIMGVTQSPMNAARWCLDLSCGHQAWITSHRRPTQRVWHLCQQCVEPSPDRTQEGK